MSIIRLIRLILDNKTWLILFPLALAAGVFYMTRKQDNNYKASTLIYTGLASGYTIESEGSGKSDYSSINNAFDNLINTIKARTTIEEVGLRLLASHLMLRYPDNAIANEVTFQRLHEALPDSLVKRLVDYNSVDNTIRNLNNYIILPNNLVSLNLLIPDASIYGLKGITRSLVVQREGSSDMVKIAYESNDAAVTKNTLVLISDVFMNKHKELKVSETGNVVSYFEEQLQKASEKLYSSEDNLKDFSTKNKIVNFEEQSKYVAEQDNLVEQEIQKEKAALEAAKATFKNLNNRLSLRQDVALKNEKLADLRDSLSVYNSRLTLLEFNPDANKESIRNLKSIITKLENKTKSDISDIYDINNSKNGVPNQMLFTDWIQSFIDIDKSEAKLLILSDVKRNAERYTNQFAPLGASLSKLEREISVAEKEYLEILHGLNVSKLREQNLLMSSHLKVIDPPKYPAEPEDSKRLLLVAISYILGMVLVIFVIIAREFFDGSMKNPARAVEEVGLPFIGALPFYQPRKKSINYEKMESQLLNQLMTAITIETDYSVNNNLIVICSNRPKEGKSYLASKLAEKLEASICTSMWIHPHEKQPEDYAFNYTVTSNFVHARNIEDLGLRRDPGSVNYVFLELPALFDNPTPTRLIANAKMIVYLVDATRSWKPADKFILDNLRKIAGDKIVLFVNKVKYDQLEDLIGELPRKRSWFRRKIKNIIA